MDTCICMAESLHCSSETITTLLNGYIPGENKQFKLKKKREISKNPVQAEEYKNGRSLGP